METLAFVYGAAAFEDPNSEVEMRSPEELAKISASAVAGIVGSVAAAGLLATAPQAQAQVSDTLSLAAIDARGGAYFAYVSTSGGELTVRTGPGTNYPATGYLSNGTRVSVLSDQGSWSRLTTGGWVSNSFLQTSPGSGGGGGSDVPCSVLGGVYDCYVSTSGDDLRVRSGPGTNYSTIRYLSNGSRAPIVDVSNGWGQLDGGGWISLDFVSDSPGSGGGGGSDIYFPGDSGPGVVEIQEALAAEGYYSGVIDGVYGSGTTNAVIRFQRANGLSADGIAGPATLDLLLGTGSGGGGGSDIYFPGDSGPGVVEIQQELAAQGYYFGVIDGVYGSGTTSAVIRFQRANGLTADGIAGPATLDLLLGGASGGSGGGSDIFFPGDTGEGVADLQQALSSRSFYFGIIDGIYGSGTTDAVYRFQLSSGLAADGIAGPATLSALGL